MSFFASAALGAAAVIATYLGGFFVTGIGWAFLETFLSRGTADRFSGAVDAGFGFWREMDVITQIFFATPFIALVAAIPAYGVLRLLVPELEGGGRFWFCFIAILVLTRATYFFWRP
ncbi:MAG TPA: hypothetical protein VK002_10970 [Rubricoccaceae bacterium]|nr:hypothetical protein [Rubricoccaceae bacterium]